MILGVVGGSNNKPSPASAISSSSGRATGAERERALGHPVRAEGHRHRPNKWPAVTRVWNARRALPKSSGEGLQAGESYEIFAASAIRANPRWGYL